MSLFRKTPAVHNKHAETARLNSEYFSNAPRIRRQKPRPDDIVMVSLTRLQAETIVHMMLAHSDNATVNGSRITSSIARQLAGVVEHETRVQ